MLRRLAAVGFLAAAAICFAQPPAGLPKGLFPSATPGAPAVEAPAAPAKSTAPAPAPPVPAETRGSDGLLVVPPLARVTDTAGVLSASDRAGLEAKLAEFETSRGAQVAIIVVGSTLPEPIADYTNRVGAVWKIGRQGIGDGVLISVAVKDKRAWISVARTLEGAIPDVIAARIAREAMAPHFAKGRFADGLNAGLDAIFRRIEGEALPTPAGVPRDKVEAGESLIAAVIPLLIFGALVVALVRRLFGFPGAMLASGGFGAIAGSMLASVMVGVVVALLLLFLVGRGRGGGPRVLGGRRRRAPIVLPGAIGGWGGSSRGGWGSGGGWSGGGGWSSGGGGTFSGGGGGASW